MKSIGVMDWDVDNVWYKGISTSHCADRSPADPKPYLDGFFGKNWFSYDDVKNWQCLTDFLYKMKKGDNSVISKEQTIEGKQSLLKGMTMKQIRDIADEIKYTDGLEDTIYNFKKDGIIQTAFSDGLAPFVLYKMKKLGMDYGEGVPTIIIHDELEFMFDGRFMLEIDDIKLTGEVDKFSKFDAFKKFIDGIYPLSRVAMIDDSGANAKSMKEVMENGGLAVAFNPSDTHRKDFNSLSIPILKGTDLRAFGEIVLDPSKLKDYCE